MRLGTFDTAKLTRFSHYAGTQLSRGGSTGSILPSGSVTIPGTQVEGEGMEKALVKVLEWIDGNDVIVPQPLTADGLGIGEFPECVYVFQFHSNNTIANLKSSYAHRATMILRVDRTIRSDSVRNDIIDYVRAAPLRFNEFAMVLEVCNFDSSLATIVKNATMEFKVKGGVPDMARIEGYAQLHGMFEELKKIEQAVALRAASEKKAAEAKKAGKSKVL